MSVRATVDKPGQRHVAVNGSRKAAQDSDGDRRASLGALMAVLNIQIVGARWTISAALSGPVPTTVAGSRPPIFASRDCRSSHLRLAVKGPSPASATRMVGNAILFLAASAAWCIRPDARNR